MSAKVVMSAKELRELADKCLSSAKTARSNRERRTLLQMAEASLEAAGRWDAKTRVAEPSHQATGMNRFW
jgi:hypothetical protein